MDLTSLWDVQTLTYVILSVLVTLVILGLLSSTNRRLALLSSEVESLRREMKLVDEGVQSVARHLQSTGGQTRAPGTLSLAEADARDRAAG